MLQVHGPMTEHEIASELREPFGPLIRPVLEVLRVCKLVSLLRCKPHETAAPQGGSITAQQPTPASESLPVAADPAAGADAAPNAAAVASVTQGTGTDEVTIETTEGGAATHGGAGLSFFERHYGAIGRYGGHGDGIVRDDEVWCFGDGSVEMYSPTDEPLTDERSWASVRKHETTRA